MRIVNLLINELVLKAELSLKHATSENLIDQCRNYLKVLGEYRDQLTGLRGLPELNNHHGSLLGQELVAQARSAVRSAIEITVRETNRTQALLDSFTSITVHQAAETLNLLSYKGQKNWTASSGGVRTSDNAGFHQLSVQDAVETAGRLRREAYVAINTIVEGSIIPTEINDNGSKSLFEELA